MIDYNEAYKIAGQLKYSVSNLPEQSVRHDICSGKWRHVASQIALSSMSAAIEQIQDYGIDEAAKFQTPTGELARFIIREREACIASLTERIRELDSECLQWREYCSEIEAQNKQLLTNLEADTRSPRSK